MFYCTPCTNKGDDDEALSIIFPLSQVESKKPLSWHHFEHNGAIYVVLLNEERTGLLATPVGSNGESVVAPSNSQSVLYRWQGMLVPVQVRLLGWVAV